MVFFVQCEPDSASSVHLHGFDEVRVHPYDHSLYWNVIKHLIYIEGGSLIQSELVLGLNHDIVVWIVPNCYSDSAAQPTSMVLWSKDDHQLHWKVLTMILTTIISVWATICPLSLVWTTNCSHWCGPTSMLFGADQNLHSLVQTNVQTNQSPNQPSTDQNMEMQTKVPTNQW